MRSFFHASPNTLQPGLWSPSDLVYSCTASPPVKPFTRVVAVWLRWGCKMQVRHDSSGQEDRWAEWHGFWCGWWFGASTQCRHGSKWVQLCWGRCCWPWLRSQQVPSSSSSLFSAVQTFYILGNMWSPFSLHLSQGWVESNKRFTALVQYLKFLMSLFVLFCIVSISAYWHLPTSDWFHHLWFGFLSTFHASIVYNKGRWGRGVHNLRKGSFLPKNVQGIVATHNYRQTSKKNFAAGHLKTGTQTNKCGDLWQVELCNKIGVGPSQLTITLRSITRHSEANKPIF